MGCLCSAKTPTTKEKACPASKTTFFDSNVQKQNKNSMKFPSNELTSFDNNHQEPPNLNLLSQKNLLRAYQKYSQPNGVVARDINAPHENPKH
jgi:hypothetical protein